ncbi:MAG: hypothetical protein HY694_01755 [Deltaproteobacteria bacterium]|nr:hypothetical protein [Deltaproteobacteria bacterium]
MLGGAVGGAVNAAVNNQNVLVGAVTGGVTAGITSGLLGDTGPPGSDISSNTPALIATSVGVAASDPASRAATRSSGRDSEPTQTITIPLGGTEARLEVDPGRNVIGAAIQVTGPHAQQIGRFILEPDTFFGIRQAGSGIEVGVGPNPAIIDLPGPINPRVSSIVFSAEGNVLATDISHPFIPGPLLRAGLIRAVGNQKPLVDASKGVLRDLSALIK